MNNLKSWLIGTLSVLTIQLQSQNISNKLSLEQMCLDPNESEYLIVAKSLKEFEEVHYQWKINNKNIDTYSDSLKINLSQYKDVPKLLIECSAVIEDFITSDTLYNELVVYNIRARKPKVDAKVVNGNISFYVEYPKPGSIYKWKYNGESKTGKIVRYKHNQNVRNATLYEVNERLCKSNHCSFSLKYEFKNINANGKGLRRLAFKEIVETRSSIYGSTAVNPDDKYTMLRTFYGTNRNSIDKSFGSELTDSIKYGYLDISVPKSNYHKKGNVEEPKWWKLEFNSDPNKHIHIHSIEKQNSELFFDSLSTSKGSSKQALIFIHGYNVEFEEAAKRTAQFSYDISFPGKSIFFSWPSKGKLSKYFTDSQSIEYSRTYYKQFIDSLFSITNIQKFHFVAHSMGSRALVSFIEELENEDPNYKQKIGEIIFCAPDIGTVEFERVVKKSNNNITLYASSDDFALKASKLFNGFVRAGEGGDKLFLNTNIESIDASGIDNSFLGHSYHTTVKEALNDIYELINNQKRAIERKFNLLENNRNGSTYYTFKL